jgi:hypothetical protein
MNSRDIFPPPLTRLAVAGTPATHTAERSGEAAAKTDIVLREARGEVDRQYAAIVRTLNINIAKTVAAMGKRRGKQQQPEEVI